MQNTSNHVDSNVTNVQSMFQNASSFNKPIREIFNLDEDDIKELNIEMDRMILMIAKNIKGENYEKD